MESSPCKLTTGHNRAASVRFVSLTVSTSPWPLSCAMSYPPTGIKPGPTIHDRSAQDPTSLLLDPPSSSPSYCSSYCPLHCAVLRSGHQVRTSGRPRRRPTVALSANRTVWCSSTDHGEVQASQTVPVFSCEGPVVKPTLMVSHPPAVARPRPTAQNRNDTTTTHTPRGILEHPRVHGEVGESGGSRLSVHTHQAPHYKLAITGQPLL